MASNRRESIVRAVALALLAGVAAYSVLTHGSAGGSGRLTGSVAHSFQLDELNGRGPLGVAAEQGHGVILSFWATWCAACRQELPLLEEMHRELAGDDLLVLTVSDEDPATLRRFLTKRKLTLPVLLDQDGDVQAAYGVSGLPYTVVIGPTGTVVEDFVGVPDATRLFATGRRLAACAKALRDGGSPEGWCRVMPSGPAAKSGS